MAIDPRVDIGHVHLKVADIDRALGFYRDILGFEVKAQIPEDDDVVSPLVEVVVLEESEKKHLRNAVLRFSSPRRRTQLEDLHEDPLHAHM